MKFTGERFVVGQAVGDIVIEHLQRYNTVAPLVKGKAVLDAACGDGYGSYILAAQADSVVGIDISHETVEYAGKRYVRDNLRYKCASVETLPLPDKSIDVVVSFETIEHVPQDIQRKFLQEIKRVLKADGLLFMSSPDKKIYSDIRSFANPYHVHEMYEQEFIDLLANYFKAAAFFRQGIDDKRLGVIEPLRTAETLPSMRLINDLNMSPDAMQYILAVCSDQPLASDITAQLVSVMPFVQEQPVRLFIDSGAGFNEEEVLVGEVTAQENWLLVRFLLSDFANISGLRFDPIEKAGCYCKIEHIDSDGKNITVVPHNAFDAAAATGERFLTIDPQYLITGDFKGMTYLSLKYKFTLLPAEKLSELWQGAYDAQRMAGEQMIAEREQTIAAHEQRIAAYVQTITESDKAIEGLLSDKAGLENYLQEIQGSRGYRLLQKYYNLRDKCLPRGSSRRLLIKNFIKAILNIAKVSSFCTADNLTKVMSDIRRGNFRQLLIKIDSKLNSPAVVALLAQDTIHYGNAWLRETKPVAGSATIIDIVVPIYNAFAFTQKCVASVYKNTDVPYNLYLIDDCSSDERIKTWLAELAQADRPSQLRNLYIIKNTENLGFIKSVNKGIAQGDNNVVLLNTDTEVPPGWLARLVAPMSLDAKIASVTPFSNCATICSFPKFCADNELPAGLTVDDVDAVFARYGGGSVIELPTGVGFCMLLSRECLNKFGSFDTVYGKGYGEENDWCRRVASHGYKNVLVANLFVYHKHGVSFAEHKDKAKAERIRENLAILLERYPDYTAVVDAFIANDVGKTQREFLASIVEAKQAGIKQGILFVNHSLGGGTKVYQDKLISQWGMSKRLYGIELQTDGKTLLFSDYNGDKQRSFYFDLANLTESMFRELTVGFGIELIYINQLVTYPPAKIMALITAAKIDYIYFVHDYYAACPRYTLINDKGKYCYAEQEHTLCNDCLAAGNKVNCRNIYEWRSMFQQFLSGAKAVIAPSHCAADILNKYYPNLSIIVKEHELPAGICNTYDKAFATREILNVGLIGAIGEVKGSQILYELVDKIRREKLPIHVKVIGITDLHNKYYQSADGVLEVTGAYEQSQISGLLAKLQIGVVLIPSILPETYSYTTSEAMYSGYPVIAFDLGAPAERIERYACGWIIKEQSSEAIFTLLKLLLTDRQQLLQKAFSLSGR